MAVKKPENMKFEETLNELEDIVQQLEQGELSLEESLKQFERGISLANAGQSKLQQAQQQVDVLRHQASGDTLEPLIQEPSE
ncbi:MULTISPECIES: exodeoxyribonuclease VII small subunit [Agarivorans]|jgi:exodeoxyribonuclease VII small subunit|uniref:Exodeoxyribonuclease 7 small subunit n=1 Tax=Agarivorans gilvus TaxID=680279 RepID=A0ABQ1I049_9ALTE|nr:exodeoxyribonuclease VII small subunit [Agarivorans gilvus]GGA99891.1 exodeoxyribonuclease 7 small subunit [Agarivorans gilvus]